MGSPPLLVELSPRRWMLDGLATTIGGALTPAVDQVKEVSGQLCGHVCQHVCYHQVLLLSPSSYQPDKYVSAEKDQDEGNECANHIVARLL